MKHRLGMLRGGPWALLLLLLTACRPPAAPPADEHAHEQAEGGHGDEHEGEGHHPMGEDEHGAAGERRVELAGQRGIGFVVVAPPQEEGAWFAAEAVGDETSQRLLTTPVAGIVTGIAVAPGVAVPAGTPLLTVQSPELAQLAAEWLTAQARLARSRAERAREERLLAGGAGSERELEAARSDEEVARAEADAARLHLEARGVSPNQAGAQLVVRAPLAGAVLDYAVLVGQGVAAGERLGAFQAGAATRVLLELPLPGPAVWSPGARTEVRRGDGHRWSAEVESVPPALSADTRRLPYRLRLTAGPFPLPGTPLEVRVPLARAIVLPQDALQRVEGVWGVFVHDGDTAVFRPVRRGAELGGDVLVLDGVLPGEEVATEGAYLLKALLLKAAGGGHHEH